MANDSPNHRFVDSIMRNNYDKMMDKVRSGELREDQIRIATMSDVHAPSEGDIASTLGFYQMRMGKLSQTFMRFSIFSQSPGMSTFEYERCYREYFDDIIAHKKFWFDEIFDVDDGNPVHAERTSGILGTLCTLLRQRGDLKGCMEVMPTYVAVLGRYQQMAAKPGTEEAMKHCARILTYKCNLIRLNCGCQLPNRKMAVKAFHDIVECEKIQKQLGSPVETDWIEMFELFFLHTNFKDMSDEDLFKFLSYNINGDRQSALRRCNFCDKVEEMFGDFGKCAKCQKQIYCSRQCQKADWGVHKQICGKENTTNIPSEELHCIIDVIMKNYTYSIESDGGRKISAKDKKNAKVKLTGQLKTMFTKEFPQFNSELAANDAGTDPGFYSALIDFFEKQPGYELWSLMREGALEYNAKLKKTRPYKFDESILSTVCKNMTQTIIMGWGGGEGGVNDLKLHAALQNDLETLHKTFALEHPEYNSNSGLKDMAHHEDFQNRMAETINRGLGRK